MLPTDDLSSYTVIDVTGWAPTADSAALLVNDCSGDGSYFNIDTGTAGNLIGTDDDTVVAACEAAALLSDTVYCNNAANLVRNLASPVADGICSCTTLTTRNVFSFLFFSRPSGL